MGCLQIILLIVALLIPSVAPAATYYLSPAGSDSANCGLADPCQTITKAQSIASGGDTVVLSSGDYGTYTETAGRTGTVTYQAATGETPVLSGIEVDYVTLANAGLVFKGLTIYGGASLATMAVFDNVQNVTIDGCIIHAPRWSINSASIVTAMQFSYADNIIIKDTYIYEMGRGIQLKNCNNFLIDHNYIKMKGGTGIQFLGESTDVIVQNNHMTGDDYTPYPEDPLAIVSPHQSMVSIRGDNIIIRGNVFHGMGSSSGIMTYIPDVAGGETSYDNVTIENNAIYDVTNVTAIRFYNLGDNVLVRNNTVFSQVRTGACGDGLNVDARYRYEGALSVESLASGKDGSGLSLYNNIFMGIVFAPSTVSESGNIYWSLSRDKGTTWEPASDGATNKILTASYGCGTAPLVFENQTYFRDAINLLYPSIAVTEFVLSPTSPAIGFGTVDQQYSTGLGLIGVDGFLSMNGVARSSSAHSAGAYEPNTGKKYRVRVSTGD